VSVGTGKTATLAELIIQAVKLNQRILVCAPSNAAVDNLLDRVLHHDGSKGIQVVRLGHPARIDNHLLDYCLDSQIAQCDGKDIVNDIKKEIDSLRSRPRRDRVVSSAAADSNDGATNKQMSKKERYSMIRQLQKDLRRYEKKMVQDLIKSCHLIFASCVGASSSLLRDSSFDLVIIDEAAQAREAECWIPIQLGKRVVLAGDPNQLPPTIKSQVATSGGLAISLLERLMRDPRFQNVTYLLDTQYRMHMTICEWASNAMYNHQLVSHSSASQRSLNDWLPSITSEADASGEGYAVMTIIDTSGCDLEEVSTVTGSRYNEVEGEVVRRYASLLLNAGAKAEDIGVITPYSGQVSYLRTLFSSQDQGYPVNALQDVAVRTVDGFQGGEKEIIVLSMVRSNDAGEVGFLSDRRRINVAITRARRHLAVIGDVATCSEDEFIGQLLDYISSHGDHRSAMELLQDDWRRMSLSYEPYLYDDPSSSSDAAAVSGSSSSASMISKTPKQRAKSSELKKSSTASAAKASSPSKLSDDEYSAAVNELLSAFADYAPISVKAMQLTSASVSSTNMLIFASSISSFHRHLIHEACERYPALTHSSSGDGNERQLTITRPTEPIQRTAAVVVARQLAKVAASLKPDIAAQPAAKTNSNAPIAKTSSSASKRSSKKKKAQSVGSLNLQIPDQTFESIATNLLEQFASYRYNAADEEEDELFNELNLSIADDDENKLVFPSTLPPHQRNMLRRLCGKHSSLRYDVVGDSQLRVHITRPPAPVAMTAAQPGYQHLANDDDDEDDEPEAASTATAKASATSSSLATGTSTAGKKSSAAASLAKPAPKGAMTKEVDYKSMTEDEALRLAMEEVRAHEHEHQYRLKSTAFPNNDKIKRQQHLHSKLEEAAKDRISKSAKELNSKRKKK
jgi:predicted DNA helicase